MLAYNRHYERGHRIDQSADRIGEREVGQKTCAAQRLNAFNVKINNKGDKIEASYIPQTLNI